MQEDSFPSKDNSRVSSLMHKRDAGGVPEQKWFVLCVHTNTEVVSSELLEKAGYEAFVAYQKVLVVYASRNKRVKKVVRIKGLVFVHATERQLNSILPLSSNFFYWMQNKAGISNEFGRAPYATIPDGQLNMLRLFLGQSDYSATYEPGSIKPNEKVRVLYGVFKDYEGLCLHESGKCQLVLLLEALGGTIKVELPADFVQRITV